MVILSYVFSVCFSLPDILLLHFTQGIPHNNFKELEFEFEGQYSVTGVVQYKNNPDHFVTYIRNGLGMFIDYVSCDLSLRSRHH